MLYFSTGGSSAEHFCIGLFCACTIHIYNVTLCKDIYEVKMYTAALLAVFSIVFLSLPTGFIVQLRKEVFYESEKNRNYWRFFVRQW